MNVKMKRVADESEMSIINGGHFVFVLFLLSIFLTAQTNTALQTCGVEIPAKDL